MSIFCFYTIVLLNKQEKKINEKVEQNKKSAKKDKFILYEDDIPLWVYNMCQYISEEHMDKLNGAQLDCNCK